MQLFESAATQGYAEAQYMVGYLMQSGDLGKPRPDAAFVWSKLAAEKGIELATDLNYMTTLVLDEAEQARAQQLTDLCRSSNFTDCPK
jgi:TPR repeat protein